MKKGTNLDPIQMKNLIENERTKGEKSELYLHDYNLR